MLTSMSLVSCGDVLEADITNEEIVLLAPLEGTTSTRLSTGFFWEGIPGVIAYQVQVASPSFGNPSYFVTDTIVDASGTRLLLEPGIYQWRVRGFNSGYQTSYSTATFSIDE
jgi:hypothetical protein